jgi:hypothetical protein
VSDEPEVGEEVDVAGALLPLGSDNVDVERAAVAEGVQPPEAASADGLHFVDTPVLAWSSARISSVDISEAGFSRS